MADPSPGLATHRVTARLETARLQLVPLAVSDAVEMADVLADPRLYEFTGGSPPTVDELRARYAQWMAGHSADDGESWLNWLIRLRGESRAIGHLQATIVGGVGSSPEGPSADIAWVIGQEWQGRGFAGEAAQALVSWLAAKGVATVTAHIHPSHSASEGVAGRAGLRPTDLMEDGERVWRGDLRLRYEPVRE